MNRCTQYPFSDLTPDQFDRLTQAAHQERSETLRRILRGLFRRRHQAPLWPPRLRETQVWPSKSQPALSLKAYI